MGIEVPRFGALEGVKVVSSGISVAGPYAASMMADQGAVVTFVESPFIKDQVRTTITPSFLDRERRNHKTMALDMKQEKGREVFLKLIAEADIFVENSKAGAWAKRGFSDEVLWEVNPKLVICHVSGFGQTGLPEYLERGSYDTIGQAMSGYMNFNGEPDGEPMPAPSYTCDYVCAMVASWSCLAAYIKAQKTGEGESIDCCQYETMMMVNGYGLYDYLNCGMDHARSGSSSPTFAGCKNFKCKDGLIYVFWLSTPCFKEGLPLIGLEYGSEDFPEGIFTAGKGTPQGDKLDEALARYCASKTVAEAEKELNDHHVTAVAILDWKGMAEHPQLAARGSISEWEGFRGEKVRGVGIVPQFTKHPGQIWRAAPHYGEDNRAILEHLGYRPEEIEAMYEGKVVVEDSDF